MKTILRFADCEWWILLGQHNKLRSISNKDVVTCINEGWAEFHKTKSDSRRTNPKKKQKKLDRIAEIIEALNNEQFRRLKSVEHKRFTQALKAGFLFRRAKNDIGTVGFPNSPNSPRV